MATKGSDLSGKCGACRRKVSQGIGCEDCGQWFHWECAGTNNELALLPWYCNSCVQAMGIKKQEETILSIRELEFAKTEISLLKEELNLVDNCSEELRTVSNSRRKHKIVSSALDTKFTSTNRFEPLAMLEPQTDGNSVDQPASAESSYKPIFKAKPKHQILVLGSCHGRGIGQRLQNAMGDGYAVTSIFKPNADLRSVTGDTENLYVTKPMAPEKVNPVSRKNFDVLSVLGARAFGKDFLVRKTDSADSGHLYAMKVLAKADIIKTEKIVEYTRTERQVLEEVRWSPFLRELHYAFQTSEKLHLILGGHKNCNI
ncbi:uncharacterized protein LOC111868339 isoform X2 [Cryptotermes secundus]|uniref:uncharacterized protein LOC111868339 isoform X2 n=1 Tax=Cryptotermes secundus TaxID=105785 RepID=UPI001454D95D|nr:uncharacterized protein LOC111868339 isoform X2 [Cryptotermes secundus]